MPKIICEAIIVDANLRAAVTRELKELRVPFQCYRDYIHVDYSTKSLGKIRQIRGAFAGLGNCSIKQIG